LQQELLVGRAVRSAELARVEAALFQSAAPVGSRRLALVCGLADATQARTLVGQLNGLYDQEGSAFRVEEIAGGYQLLTRPGFGVWLRRLEQGPAALRLSAPAMETLAVVAYRQPVLRAEVEAVRGVQCGEILRQLMDRDLVRIVGRSSDLGRPLLYGTTRRFLEFVGMKSLKELPRAELLRRDAPESSAPDSSRVDGAAAG
jgi:segregation and condensation protein B